MATNSKQPSFSLSILIRPSTLTSTSPCNKTAWTFEITKFTLKETINIAQTKKKGTLNSRGKSKWRKKITNHKRSIQTHIIIKKVESEKGELRYQKGDLTEGYGEIWSQPEKLTRCCGSAPVLYAPTSFFGDHGSLAHILIHSFLL